MVIAVKSPKHICGRPEHDFNVPFRVQHRPLHGHMWNLFKTNITKKVENKAAEKEQTNKETRRK